MEDKIKLAEDLVQDIEEGIGKLITARNQGARVTELHWQQQVSRDLADLKTVIQDMRIP